MRQIRSALTATLVLALAAGGLFAADEKRVAEVYKTPDLLNKQVKNKNGDHLGYLEDLVIDVNNGRVAYAVLSTKDAVGFGGRLYALPLNAFVMSPDLKFVSVDTPKETFDDAEGFDANRWPMKVDERWMKLGRKTAATDEPRRDEKDKDAMLRRLTSLNGMAVKTASGDDLGKIQGFAVDVTNGKVNYAAMSYGGVVGVGSKYFAIPWKALELKSLNLRVQDRAFVLNANKADFENKNGFDRNNWPTVGEERFGRDSKTREEK